MEYTLYFAFGTILLGCTYYIGRKILKRINVNKLTGSVAKVPSFDYASDDFICLLKTDGSSAASSGGATVLGRRINTSSSK